jgi:hypothetical protein
MNDTPTPQHQPSAEAIAMKELRMNARNNHAAALIYIRKLEEEVKRLRASERPGAPMEFEVPTNMKWPLSPSVNESEDAE